MNREANTNPKMNSIEKKKKLKKTLCHEIKKARPHRSESKR